MTISIFPVTGLAEFHPGDDLGPLIDRALAGQGLSLEPGDIVVVTSKIVSKAEGRLVEAVDREESIVAETKRVVARRGSTTISQTQHGFVMAAAGVDASDIPDGMVALLPIDPDASARRLRAHWGGRVAVIITDTFGRPWREGLIDQALGVAGLDPLLDYRGEKDTFGRPLQATIMAVADEIASASELVRGKSVGVPVAIARGLAHLVRTDDGPGVEVMLRDGESDWFRFGHRDLVTSRRTIREFTRDEVPRALIDVAIQAALTAPAPHHTKPMRFVVVESEPSRMALLKAMEEQWRTDLSADGLGPEQIERRIARGAVLHGAPVLIAPFLIREGAHSYPDQRRSGAEERMFLLAAGAAIQNLMLALHGEGIGSAWVSSSLFCPDVVIDALDAEADWEPLGLVAVGYPASTPDPRAHLDLTQARRYV